MVRMLKLFRFSVAIEASDGGDVICPASFHVVDTVADDGHGAFELGHDTLKYFSLGNLVEHSWAVEMMEIAV